MWKAHARCHTVFWPKPTPVLLPRKYKPHWNRRPQIRVHAWSLEHEAANLSAVSTRSVWTRDIGATLFQSTCVAMPKGPMAGIEETTLYSELSLQLRNFRCISPCPTVQGKPLRACCFLLKLSVVTASTHTSSHAKRVLLILILATGTIKGN